MSGYLGNLGRSVLEGLTFNNAGEIEAALRAMAQGDPERYRQLKQQVESDYQQWQAQNPKAALAGEFGGALLPGVAGAFVPGGQGATLSAAGMLPRIGRVMAEPLTVAAERYMPSLAVRARHVRPFADELLTGAVQSVGSANSRADVPERIAEDLPWNAVNSLAVRVANATGGKLYRVYKGRK